MTSTNFNIGLSNEKNSSRVLRPPGGGHSDIFGLRDNQNELVTPSKRKHYPQSTIGSCLFSAENHQEQKSEIQNGSVVSGEEPIKVEEKHEVDNGTDENKAPGEIIEEKEPEKKEEQPVTAPKRGRVPPGGYSTALW